MFQHSDFFGSASIIDKGTVVGDLSITLEMNTKAGQLCIGMTLQDTEYTNQCDRK